MIRIQKLLIISAFAFILSSSAVAQSGGIKGKVRTNSGNSIPNATITARQRDKDIKTVRSDVKGNFTMQGLEAGRYSIVFDAPGYASGVLYNVEVKNKSTRDLGDRLILNVDPGSQVIVRGSVFFKEGTSVTGAAVEIERVNSDGSSKRIGSGYTNYSGEFSFRQPPGAARLRVTAKYKGITGTKEIEVEGAAIYRLAITLDLSGQNREQ